MDWNVIIIITDNYSCIKGKVKTMSIRPEVRFYIKRQNSMKLQLQHPTIIKLETTQPHPMLFACFDVIVVTCYRPLGIGIVNLASHRLQFIRALNAKSKN